MQPKTCGLTIINDILEKIEEVDLTVVEHKGETATDSSGKTRDKKSFLLNSNETDNVFNAGEEIGGAEGSNRLELQAIATINEKVIPLYTSEDAVVRVFMIHGSQKSALALASFALGFQQQVIYLS